MSEARSSIFCRGPNWPRSCSSGPPLPPFPPPPQLSHFRKIGPEKFWTNQSGCGLPTASASPGPGTATFQFFQPRYLALTFWRDSLQPNYLQNFCLQQQQCTRNVFRSGQKFGRKFLVPNGTAADLNACSVNPGFHFFPPSSFLNF